MIDFITQRLQLFGPAVNNPTPGDLGLPPVRADPAFAQNVFGIIFGIAGALAVLIIIIASLNLAKAGGNPEEISKAKKTIVYALVGLAIAVLAEAIVYLVIGKL